MPATGSETTEEKNEKCEDWEVEDFTAWEKKMKDDTGQEGAGNQAPALVTSAAACPTALRKRTRRSGRKMTHLRTKGQFIIRLRNKGEPNWWNVLEKP